MNIKVENVLCNVFIKTVTDYTAKASSEKRRRLQYEVGGRSSERGSCNVFGKSQLDAKRNENHCRKELNIKLLMDRIVGYKINVYRDRTKDKIKLN